ncbi:MULTISPECIES: SusC/RagA family TonB-linked outer membrane protein [Niastella]|uniref:SusC/RagA family TonB-linked outer membrane protein n=1 Tax=Niastella soli TaxID=2821487 RepID=A0ABS3YYG5_9BACT|nr:SusC/RagA family TonB-linked outer membrane protein [Niastella soli]MBO9202967.1 SusC/RagA family TonB-linked outer membrane protein [Niastella soli]
MKLTAVFILAGFLQVSAAGFSQTVSVTKENIPLQKLFREIKKQTGYVFFYNMRLLQKTHPVSIDVKSKGLREVLDLVFESQPVTYSIVNKTIVVNDRAPLPVPAEVKQVDTVPAIDIHGKVIDAVSGTPVAGANVVIKGSNAGVVTDAAGNFVIRAKPGSRLLISYVGFEGIEVTAKDSQLSVKLRANTPMTDVVITGYQQIKKESYTGNAVTVTGEELKRVNPNNMLQAIQAYDPSFQVAQNNLLGSNPNSLPRVNVRGSASLPVSSSDVLTRNNLAGNVNLPTFILDGYEVSVEKVFDLDVNRIQTITLLKDAAATAVYGSRAANGVLVITTKAPQEGKLQLTYSYDGTVSAPDLTDYHVLNAEQKLEYERLAGLYEPVGSRTKDQQDYLYYSKRANVLAGVNTYWLSQPVRTAFGNKNSLYLEGGNATIRYGLDLRYQTQPGVMKKSGRDRYGLGSVISYAPNKKFIFRNTLTVTQVTGNESPYGSFSNYVAMNPYYPKTDSNGHILQAVDSWVIDTRLTDSSQYKNQSVLNPVYNGTLSNFNRTKYTEIIEAFNADWNITSALRLRGLASVTKRKTTTDKFMSPLSNEFFDYPTDKLKERGSYIYSTVDENAFDGSLTLNYNKQLGDHFLNLAAGVNMRTASTDARGITAIGFSNDRFTNIAFANKYAENSSPDASYYLERLFGSFMSLNYSYRNKYMADLSARLDGSSKFGNENKTAPFWSFGLGWNVHKEDFMLNSAISTLRLRASTGLTGQVNFAPYQSKTTYDYYTNNWYSTGIGAAVTTYGNEALKWQKTDNYDASIDLGLFRDKLYLSTRFYQKLTHGLLADVILPPSTGFSAYKDNLGDMRNTGVEMTLKVTAYKSRNWTVNLTANMVRSENRILKISNALKTYNDNIDAEQTKDYKATPLLRYNEGQSLNTIYAVHSLGIDPENGKEIYLKRDGSQTYNWDVKDVVPVADNTPFAYGYFGPNITYKRFLLNALFYARWGGKEYNQTIVDRIENANPRYNVDSRVLTDRWKKPGDHSLYKDIRSQDVTYVSDRFIQNDNVLELQSVYLSYDFEKRIYSKLSMRNLRVAFTMNDLWHWSTMKQERGIDYPFARSFTFSIQTSL